MVPSIAPETSTSDPTDGALLQHKLNCWLKEWLWNAYFTEQALRTNKIKLRFGSSTHEWNEIRAHIYNRLTRASSHKKLHGRPRKISQNRPQISRACGTEGASSWGSALLQSIWADGSEGSSHIQRGQQPDAAGLPIQDSKHWAKKQGLNTAITAVWILACLNTTLGCTIVGNDWNS